MSTLFCLLAIAYTGKEGFGRKGIKIGNAFPHCRKIMSTSTLLPKVDPLYGPYYFDQTVDHLDSESTTTFKQRYWVNSDWYKAGGPVICK